MKTVAVHLGATTILEYTSNDDGTGGGLVARYTKPSYESNRFTETNLPPCYKIYFLYLAEVADKIAIPEEPIMLDKMRTIHERELVG